MELIETNIVTLIFLGALCIVNPYQYNQVDRPYMISLWCCIERYFWAEHGFVDMKC